jgi:hypothetical protein
MLRWVPRGSQAMAIGPMPCARVIREPNEGDKKFILDSAYACLYRLREACYQT